MEMDDGSIGRNVGIPEDVAQALEELRQAQIAKFGHEPERVFEGAPPFEVVEHWTVEAMKKAGIDPAIIFAFEETGLLVGDHNINKMPDTDIAEWEATISKYEKKTGQKAMRRRLSKQDFENILQNGPQQAPPAHVHVERLPFPPPFTKEVWEQRPLQDIFDVPEYFDYFKRCLAEVVRSGRAVTYLNTFSVMAHCNNAASAAKLHPEDLREIMKDRDFSVEELKIALESVALSIVPNGAMPNAAEAFEFLAVIGDFVSTMIIHDQLNDSLAKINGLAMLAFISAVNVEFGMDDAWGK